MPKKRYNAEEIIHKLREADVLQGQGRTVSQACKQIGISDQTYYRWRKSYGGMKVDQAKRLKELEAENARLKRAVADLTADKLILKEVAEGKY
jgi:putative transposase